MFEVYLERAAERDLRRLPTYIFDRIIRQIKHLAKSPRPVGCHKILGSKSDWRIRSGDYRIVYEIDGERQTVKVMRIRHRREVYR